MTTPTLGDKKFYNSMQEARHHPFTLCNRHGRLRDHSSASRWMHLSHLQVGDRHCIQSQWLNHALLAHVVGNFTRGLNVKDPSPSSTNQQSTVFAGSRHLNISVNTRI